VAFRRFQGEPPRLQLVRARIFPPLRFLKGGAGGRQAGVGSLSGKVYLVPQINTAQNLVVPDSRSVEKRTPA